MTIHAFAPAAACLFAVSACLGAATIETVVDSSEVIRADIGRETFGAGIEFQTPQFRWFMDSGPGADGPGTAAQKKLKSLNLGSVRFPNGDGTQLYFWDDPQHSIPNSNGKDPRSKWITQEQILKYTSAPAVFADGLDMQRLFQVNSCQFLDYERNWAVRQVDRNFFKRELPAEIDDEVLERVATRAANWVDDNNRKPAHERVVFWEIGNEDWIYWTGAQYGKIFTRFREKMIAKRPDIKLLAQGLSADFVTKSNGTNTMENWVDGLRSNVPDPAKSIYAYSDHQYMSAEEYSGDPPEQQRLKQTGDMLAKVAEGKRTGNLKAKLASSPLTSSWKIWVTEFNLYQRRAGKLSNPQDMGHALVIADWTGMMLRQNVGRMFYHSLDHHPDFALMQYVNEGASIAAPRVTAPGYAYSIFPQEFGDTMIGNTISGNVALTAANGMNYPQVAVYSSIRHEKSTGDTMRVIVINRSMESAASFHLKTSADDKVRHLKTGGKFIHRHLSSAKITDSNRLAADTVAWSAPVQGDIGADGAVAAEPAAGSVNLFVIQLQ